MPNIFDGLEKMDDEKLRYQIETLETVTIANVTSEMVQKAAKDAIKFVNAISGMFNKREYSDPEVASIEDRITLAKQTLEKMDRAGLNSRMKQLLIDKVNAAGAIIDSNPSDDEISVAVIETAAKRYKNEISESLSPAQKADAIRHRYNEKLIEQTRKYLNNQTVEERRKTDVALQSEIDNITQRQQRELVDALGINGLNRSKVYKSENILIYELMAQVVWCSIGVYGKKFTSSEVEHSRRPSENDSARISELNVKITEVNNRNRSSQQEKLEAEKKLAEAEALFNKKKERFEDKAKQTTESDIPEKEEYERLKASLEKAQSELEKKEKEIMEIEELSLTLMEEKEEAQKQIEELTTQAKDKQDEIEKVVEELSKSNEDLSKSNDELNNKISKKAKRLEQRWAVAFNKIRFETGVTKKVIKNFHANDLGEIEARLVEMQGTNDPMSLRSNLGKMSDGRPHIGFMTTSGCPGRIFYKVDTEHYPRKMIVVSEIVKHNDSRYGK